MLRPELVEIVEDELNVKHVRTLDATTEAVSYTLNPLPKQLGQKHGRQYPAIRQAILALETEPTARHGAERRVGRVHLRMLG